MTTASDTCSTYVCEHCGTTEPWSLLGSRGREVRHRAGMAAPAGAGALGLQPAPDPGRDRLRVLPADQGELFPAPAWPARSARAGCAMRGIGDEPDGTEPGAAGGRAGTGGTRRRSLVAPLVLARRARNGGAGQGKGPHVIIAVGGVDDPPELLIAHLPHQPHFDPRRCAG